MRANIRVQNNSLFVFAFMKAWMPDVVILVSLAFLGRGAWGELHLVPTHYYKAHKPVMKTIITNRMESSAMTVVQDSGRGSIKNNSA